MDLKSIPWALAKGNRDGDSLMMRYRKFNPDFPKQSYPVRVRLTTDIKESTHTGLPTQTEYERLGEFEEDLMRSIEGDEGSVLAMVITSSGKREFIFQTSDPDDFRQRITDVYHDDNHGYDLYMESHSDDGWDLVDEYTPKD